VPRARNEARAEAEQAAFAALTRNWAHRDTPTTDIRERLRYSRNLSSTQSIAALITQITSNGQEEVLVALRTILGRDLDGPRWELVASTLDEMLSAVDDATALSDLALDLNLVGVGRAADPGQGPVTGPPDLVRQKVAQLLAELEPRR
jgi:hypothetical protein